MELTGCTYDDYRPFVNHSEKLIGQKSYLSELSYFDTFDYIIVIPCLEYVITLLSFIIGFLVIHYTVGRKTNIPPLPGQRRPRTPLNRPQTPVLWPRHRPDAAPKTPPPWKIPKERWWEPDWKPQWYDLPMHWFIKSQSSETPAGGGGGGAGDHNNRLYSIEVERALNNFAQYDDSVAYFLGLIIKKIVLIVKSI